MTIERIFLIRHGISTANLDPRIYQTTPDHQIPLSEPETDAGCVAAGDALAKFGMDPQSIAAWYSPYLRCLQTKRIALQHAFGSAFSEMFRRESFLLREQEFGDWDGLSDSEIADRFPALHAKHERLRDAYGRFYFRYPGGESRADVAARVTLFIGKIHRSSIPNHVIFLHGVTERCLRMAWFNHQVAWFEQEPNPPNASVRLIERNVSTGAWQERTLQAD